MITKTIKSKYIITDSKRIDGKFFLNNDALLSLKMKENEDKCLPLSEFAFVFNPPVFKRQFCQNTSNAVQYFQSSDVPAASEQSSIFINKKQAEKVNAIVKENQILVTGFGTIGNVRLVSKLQEGVAYANNACRIEVNQDFNYGFIYAFMASKYGKAQLNNNASGSVVRYIEAPGIKRILIPTFYENQQLEIHNLIVESADLREEANMLLQETEDILSNSLCITNDTQSILSRSEKELGSIFRFNIRNISTLSLRARNYSPRKQKIIELSKALRYDNLIDVLQCQPIYGSRYKRIEATNQAIELLSQGDIFDFRPMGRLISKRNIKNLKDELVKKETILIPAQGTLGENEIFGRAKFVWGYLENTLVAGHAMRFIPNTQKIGSGYLYAVLSSKMWFRLLRNSVYGTNLLGFIVPFLNSYPIPRFDNGLEELIDQKVKEAYDKLTLAIEKEKQAIQLVENEIEQWQH